MNVFVDCKSAGSNQLSSTNGSVFVKLYERAARFEDTDDEVENSQKRQGKLGGVQFCPVIKIGFLAGKQCWQLTARSTPVSASPVSAFSTFVLHVNGRWVADEDLRAAFDKFGRIVEVRIFKTQGFAFVRFDKKDSACNAIVKMNGTEIGGQTVKCSWGRTPEVCFWWLIARVGHTC